MAEKGTAIEKWADVAMYSAVPTASADGGDVRPTASLVSATPDPLGALAAASQMYIGQPVRRVEDITDEQRRFHFEDVKKTRLDSPFEFVDLHFLLEGVTRAFTHQIVRQRTAVYVQESMRFAVKDSGGTEVALPPSLAGTRSRAEYAAWLRETNPGYSDSVVEGLSIMELDEAQRARFLWDDAMLANQDAYMTLINSGIPAEDARGLLPTNITTRIHYKTNLRGLVGHAGNRLCTQAQFEWRLVWAEMVAAIRAYGREQKYRVWMTDAEMVAMEHSDLDQASFIERDNIGHRSLVEFSAAWQFDLIADLFRPICYSTGKCEFMSEYDRHCSIRDRVQANHEINRPSSEWAVEFDAVEGGADISGARPANGVGLGGFNNKPVFIGAIHAREWLADPASARIKRQEQ